MHINFQSVIAMLCTSVGITVSSCINVDKTLGEDLIPDNQLYNIYSVTFPIDDIRQEMADSLSAYSMYKFTFGAVRDDAFGLTTRTAAFTLVPVFNELDFGKPGTQVFRQFHFSAVSDSISYANSSQEHILQNINVYELTKPIDQTKVAPEISWSGERITDGIPVYNGSDSLSFDFSRAFGEKYMQITEDDLDTISDYTKKFPGIVISTDAPVGNGGRINMFKLPISIASYYITGSTAELKFTAEYDDRGPIDTTFLFYLGPLDFYNLKGVTSSNVTSQPQIAYDMTTHESKAMAGKVTTKAMLEGGRGLKPVIKAASLRDKILAEISKYTDNPNSVVINKASLILPFEFPEDYTEMYKYPVMISPTCRIETDTTTTYAGLTDSSASDENQGDINRSLCQYAPDISHHIQEMIKVSDDKKISNYDIWLLAMANETIAAESSTSSSDQDEYLQSLMYANYYNSMYNGYGYGGYGYGYGSYGNYYNNYYNYLTLQSLYSSANSSSTSSTQTVSMMDYHRYYKAIFNGPDSDNPPMFRLVFAVPKK